MPSYTANSDGREYRITLHTDATGLHVHVDDAVYPVDILPVGPTAYSILLNNQSYEVDCQEMEASWIVLVNGQPFAVDLKNHERRRAKRQGPAPPQSGAMITAPMGGKVVKVHVAVGEDLRPGASVCTLEAMKMENDIVAPTTGTVRAVHVTTGDTVRAGQPLVMMEPVSEG